jgi:hypothetical protein
VELGRRLGEHFPGAPEDSLAYAAIFHEPMVQTPPRGVWGKRGTPKWQTFQGFLAASVDGGSTVDEIALRYLAAFGPASVADIRYWSGLSGLRGVVERLRPRLRVFTDEGGRELFDLPDAPRPPEDAPAPVRLLPEFDNLVLSHADRSRVIADEHRKAISAKNGMTPATILVDGFVAGTWRVERRGKVATLSLAPFRPLPRRVRAEIVAEAEPLLRLVEEDAQVFGIRVVR